MNINIAPVFGNKPVDPTVTIDWRKLTHADLHEMAESMRSMQPVHVVAVEALAARLVREMDRAAAEAITHKIGTGWTWEGLIDTQRLTKLVMDGVHRLFLDNSEILCAQLVIRREGRTIDGTVLIARVGPEPEVRTLMQQDDGTVDVTRQPAVHLMPRKRKE